MCKQSTIIQKFSKNYYWIHFVFDLLLSNMVYIHRCGSLVRDEAPCHVSITSAENNQGWICEDPVRVFVNPYVHKSSYVWNSQCSWCIPSTLTFTNFLYHFSMAHQSHLGLNVSRKLISVYSMTYLLGIFISTDLSSVCEGQTIPMAIALNVLGVPLDHLASYTIRFKPVLALKVSHGSRRCFVGALFPHYWMGPFIQNSFLTYIYLT